MTVSKTYYRYPDTYFKRVFLGYDELFCISKSPYKMKLKLKYPHLFINNKVVTVYGRKWPYEPSVIWLYRMLLRYPVSNIKRIKRYKSRLQMLDDLGYVYSSPHIELFHNMKIHDNAKKYFVSELAWYGLLLGSVYASQLI